MVTKGERCKEKVWHDWANHRCRNRAVIDGYCRVHHPEERKKRRKARGPTHFERQVERSRRREHLLVGLQEHLSGDETALALIDELRSVM